MRILCCLTSGLIYFRLCFDMLAVEMVTTAMEITWRDRRDVRTLTGHDYFDWRGEVTSEDDKLMETVR